MDGVRSEQPVDDLVDRPIAPASDHHIGALCRRAAGQRGRITRCAGATHDNGPPALVYPKTTRNPKMKEWMALQLSIDMAEKDPIARCQLISNSTNETHPVLQPTPYVG